MNSPSKGKEHGGGPAQKNAYDEESAEPFLSKPAPIGFIYPPPSEQSPANPHVTQATHDPSREPNLRDSAAHGVTENNAGDKTDEKNTPGPVGTCVDTCATNCIIGAVALVIIGVVVAIVYFLIEHPKFARAIHKAMDVVHADDHDGARPSTKFAAAVKKLVKNSSTGAKPSEKHDDDYWEPEVYEY